MYEIALALEPPTVVAYMAPERFFGAPASVRSDVYELGVVLYMMLVGRLPWGSEKSVTDRLNPTNPREAGADVSPGLGRLDALA